MCRNVSILFFLCTLFYVFYNLSRSFGTKKYNLVIWEGKNEKDFDRTAGYINNVFVM